MGVVLVWVVTEVTTVLTDDEAIVVIVGGPFTKTKMNMNIHYNI